MGKMNTVARLRTWNEARLHIAKTFGFAGFVGDFWPERLGFNELAALQTVDVPEDLDAWQTALINSGLPVTIEKYERRYRYDTPGEIFEHKTLSAADFAVFLANQAEQPSRLIAVWFDAFGIARPKTETATGGADRERISNNDIAYSGLLKEPLRKDAWFQVIDDMTRAFYKEFSAIPNETQAWGQLWTKPPAGYEITTSTDKGEDCLKMPGVSALSRTAFAKRWAKYSANNGQ
jgi:hypothetical protein